MKNIIIFALVFLFGVRLCADDNLVVVNATGDNLLVACSYKVTHDSGGLEGFFSTLVKPKTRINKVVSDYMMSDDDSEYNYVVCRVLYGQEYNISTEFVKVVVADGDGGSLAIYKSDDKHKKYDLDTYLGAFGMCGHDCDNYLKAYPEVSGTPFAVPASAPKAVVDSD